MSAPKPKVGLSYWFWRGVSRFIFKVYFRGRVFGLQNVPTTGGVLLACNHESFIDPVAAGVGLARACNFMARDTLFHHPLFGRLIRSVNAFPVRRGVGDVGAVKETLRRLRRREIVVVFPTGTRSPDGSIGKINPNSLSIAKRAGATIVPTLIDGAFEALPRGVLLPRRVRIFVTYADPITVEQVRDWPNERIAEVVTQRLLAAKQQSQAGRRPRAEGPGARGQGPGD